MDTKKIFDSEKETKFSVETDNKTNIFHIFKLGAGEKALHSLQKKSPCENSIHF